MNDQTAGVEIRIFPERNFVVLFLEHRTARRGVVRPGSTQIRSLCRGRLRNEKYQQHQGIEGSHETLRLNGQ